MLQINPTVVCVLKGGGEYLPEHVIRLYAGVRRWWPHQPLRFVALTDQVINHPGVEERQLPEVNYRGWWAKVALFSAQQDDLGDILYFDLDTIIVGGLRTIVSACHSDHPVLLKDFYHPHCVQSGMMFLPAKARPEVYAAWLEGPGEITSRYRGDGEFLDALWRHSAYVWQGLVPEQVLSYKVDIRQRRGQTIPPHGRVVCFHGRPRPWQTPLWERYR